MLGSISKFHTPTIVRLEVNLHKISCFFLLTNFLFLKRLRWQRRIITYLLFLYLKHSIILIIQHFK
ncbi:hypothetical protein IPC1008_27665 [Pseudomonas aeruginosa]|nr:hypothetical protein IPC1008_27665 [Pseudomonas aeruginosa]HBP6410102.1 hypothetical protein [Pseudomonas aeruginosa]